jgi:hypothetical protein
MRGTTWNYITTPYAFMVYGLMEQRIRHQGVVLN